MNCRHPAALSRALFALVNAAAVVAVCAPRDRSWRRRAVLVAIGLLFFDVGESRAGPFMIVNGQQSDNALKFDLATGTSELFAVYEPGVEARHMAMNDRGEVFSILHEGDQTVVKLVPQATSDVLVPQNFTRSIGRFGPGQIDFYNGDLYVAGGTERVILQFDGETGAQVGAFSGSTSFNIHAMTIGDDTLYYSEIFQDRVYQFDLTQTPPAGGLFFSDTAGLADSTNIIIGHDGNLVMSNNANPLIQRYDRQTGAFLGTLVDISAIDPSRTNTGTIRYHAGLNNYFAGSGNNVYRLDTDGNLLETYQSPLLQQASGILFVVPEPASAVLLCVPAIWLTGLRRGHRPSENTSRLQISGTTPPAIAGTSQRRPRCHRCSAAEERCHTLSPVMASSSRDVGEGGVMRRKPIWAARSAATIASSTT